jgi:hypothetical protein
MYCLESYVTFKFYDHNENFKIVSLGSMSDFIVTCLFVGDADCDMFRRLKTSGLESWV